MNDIAASVFLNFSIFLLVPFFTAYLLNKIKISPLIGYIIGGLILNNFFSGVLSRESINSFAYFGIILLLFTVGLETRFDKLISLRRFIVLGGSLQILFSILFVGIIALIFNFSLLQSFLIGIALSSSSTSLVAKIIQDRGEESSFLGELAIGILIFQDLAFIPFVIIFNSLTNEVSAFGPIVLKIVIDMIVATIVLWLAYYFGQKVIPVVFNKIARSSRELLNLFIILFIFLVGYVSSLVGLPILVSIFVVGIIIAQTMEHYHIFSQIRPLRDILAIIFFIYIGTNINIGMVFLQLPQILLFTLIVVLTKAVIIITIFTVFRLQSKLSFYLALFLFQIDEDAFILTSLGYKNGLFSQDQYLFIITSVLISLTITPILINNKEKIYKILRKFIKRLLPFMDSYICHRVDADSTSIDVLNIKNHVIICGYGRVGAYVGRALLIADIPFLAIDYNFFTVSKAKKIGVNIIYGDPTDPNILDYAEVETAMALIIALPDRISQENIIMFAKTINKNLIIISRIHQKIDKQRMKDLGADFVVQPETEASLSIIKKLFLLRQIPKEEIIRYLQYLRKEEEGI